MKAITTDLPGVLIIEPQVYGDERGFFMETWNQARYAELGLPTNYVQDNISLSRRGTLRGLHVQHPNPQGKLVQVLLGEVFDVAVDIRRGSPAFERWIGVTLSANNKRQLYIPPGLAHGFCVTSETALFSYKCTDSYNPQAELSLAWNDPQLAIDWPIDNPELSAKDREGIRFQELPIERLPEYQNGQ